ncbi:DnaB helicase C-terminal domain-containing protein [Candidatus Vidania fulgoroideorum]
MNKIYLYKLERYIINCFIIDNSKLKYIKLLNNKNFTYNKNVIIFNAIKKIYNKNKKIDIITLYNYVEKKNICFEYINKISEEKIKLKNFKNYIKILKKINIRNKVYIKFKNYISLIKNKKINLKDIIFRINCDLKKILKKKKQEKIGLKKEIDIIKCKILKKNFLKKYIKTGFEKIDIIIKGFSTGDLVVVAGRPSLGKTSFCINLCEYICINNNIPIYFFSMEMSKEQILLRILSSLCNINLNKKKIKNKKKIFYCLEKIKKSNLYIDDQSNFEINKFEIDIKMICKKKNIKVIIVDYLQLINIGKKDSNRNLEISEISRFFKVLARKLNIVIILISQLNRNSELRVNKKPILSDLKDSGSIEQDADIVIFLYNKNEYKNEINILIGKNRNGNTGETILKFNKNITKFNDN